MHKLVFSSGKWDCMGKVQVEQALSCENWEKTGD